MDHVIRMAYNPSRPSRHPLPPSLFRCLARIGPPLRVPVSVPPHTHTQTLPYAYQTDSKVFLVFPPKSKLCVSFVYVG